jgi:hypothetical protein
MKLGLYLYRELGECLLTESFSLKTELMSVTKDSFFFVHSDDSFIHDCIFSRFYRQNGMPTHNSLIDHLCTAFKFLQTCCISQSENSFEN